MSEIDYKAHQKIKYLTSNTVLRKLKGYFEPQLGIIFIPCYLVIESIYQPFRIETW